MRVYVFLRRTLPDDGFDDDARRNVIECVCVCVDVCCDLDVFDRAGLKLGWEWCSLEL